MKEAAWATQWLRFTDKGLGDSKEEQRIKSCLPMVVSWCARFKRRTEDDLQTGLIGLIHAARTYTPGRASWPTHANNCIRNELSHALERAKAKKRTGTFSDQPVEVLVSREPNPAYSAQVRLDAQRVRRLFKGPDAYVVKHYCLGQTMSEVGKGLGVSQKMASLRWIRSLERGRELFAEAL
jgi:RNA polymerase sigma factor (sigma-70 family)